MIVTITLMILFIISNVCIGSDPDSIRGAGGEEKFKWTPELEAIVTRIFHETKSKGKNHQENIKEEWDRILPQFKGVRASTIRAHALSLIYRGGEKKYQHIDWTPERESDLIEMYSRITTYRKKGLACMLHDEFYKKHADVPRLSPNTLWKRAKTLYEESKQGKTDRAQRLHEESEKSHHEQKKQNTYSLQYRTQRIAQKKAEEGETSFITYHKWTRRENAELLHSYYRAKAEGAGHSWKWHERWKIMNPDVEHLNRKALLNRLQKMIRNGYEATESEDAKARVKYDKLFLKEKVRKRKGEQLGVNKGKSKIDPAAEDLADTSSRLLDLQPYQFHDFMSVDRYHGGFSNNFDENVQGTYMANSEQIYHNPEIDLNLGNYHRGESSNLPSHQQSDTALNSEIYHRGESNNLPSHQQSDLGASSPSQNTTRPFFNFF